MRKNDPGLDWHGRTLRVRRQAAGITGTRFAVESNVSESTLSRYERNLMDPPAEYVRVCARLLRCAVLDFSRPARIQIH